MPNFKLGGKPLVLGGPPPAVVKIRTYLESLPFEQLATKEDVANVLHLTEGTVKALSNHKLLAGNKLSLTLNSKRSMVLGSEKTIAALRKEIGGGK